MKKWICTVCGYVHEGEQPPEKCPQCGVPADKFKEQVEGEKEWAAEHVVGAVSYTHLNILNTIPRIAMIQITDKSPYPSVPPRTIVQIGV